MEQHKLPPCSPTWELQESSCPQSDPSQGGREEFFLQENPPEEQPQEFCTFHCSEAFPTNKTSAFGTLAQRQEFQEEISECPNHTLQCPVPRSPRERMDKEFSHLQSHHLICHLSLDSPAENKLGRQNQKGHKTNSWE